MSLLLKFMFQKCIQHLTNQKYMFLKELDIRKYFIACLDFQCGKYAISLVTKKSFEI